MKRSFRSKPIGWTNESYRHYLASKGIKTVTGYRAAKTGLGRAVERVFANREAQIRSASPTKVLLQGEMRRQAANADVSLAGLGPRITKNMSPEEVKAEIAAAEKRKKEALQTGLRPEERALKAELLKGLGVGKAKQTNLFSLATEWDPKVHGGYAIGKLEEKVSAQQEIESSARENLRTETNPELKRILEKRMNDAAVQKKFFSGEIKKTEELLAKKRSGQKWSEDDRRLAGRQVKDFNRDQEFGRVGRVEQ